MEKQLREVFPDKIVKRICDGYVNAVKEYVREVFKLEKDFFKSRKFDDAEGRTLVALILSTYPQMTYAEITNYGYGSIQLVLNRVKQGFGYLDSDNRFKKAFWGFRRVHRKLMEELFSIKIEEEWNEEEVKLTRVSTMYFYLDVNGKPVRIDIDVVKALGYIAEFVDRERGTRLLDRKKLLFNMSREDTQ